MILFDGVCKLCNAWVRFVVRFDKNKQFHFAQLQSGYVTSLGKAKAGIIQQYDSIILIEDDKIYVKSKAVLRILRQLPYWNLLCFLILVPSPLSDFFYDIVARFRYRVFGKYTSCTLPDAETSKRFLM